MKGLIILSCILALTLTLQGPAPPLWPETFTQDFVQSETKYKIYESGKIWYDIKNNRMRMDMSGSNFNQACYKLGQDAHTKCSQIVVNNTLYIQLPHVSKCCKCCSNSQGCSPPPRDWLKTFVYSGQATLSGQTFYRWSNQGQNYYATEDDKRVPRRVDYDTFAMDFIMNTYTEDKIDDVVFQLGNTCNTQCPANIGCQNRVSNNLKSIKKALFGQRYFKSFRE